jgi:hypothetical protein
VGPAAPGRTTGGGGGQPASQPTTRSRSRERGKEARGRHVGGPGPRGAAALVLAWTHTGSRFRRARTRERRERGCLAGPGASGPTWQRGVSWVSPAALVDRGGSDVAGIRWNCCLFMSPATERADGWIGGNRQPTKAMK